MRYPTEYTIKINKSTEPKVKEIVKAALPWWKGRKLRVAFKNKCYTAHNVCCEYVRVDIDTLEASSQEIPSDGYYNAGEFAVSNSHYIVKFEDSLGVTVIVTPENKALFPKAYELLSEQVEELYGRSIDF